MPVWAFATGRSARPTAYFQQLFVGESLFISPANACSAGTMPLKPESQVLKLRGGSFNRAPERFVGAICAM